MSKKISYEATTNKQQTRLSAFGYPKSVFIDEVKDE